jgi:chaperonin GroES
MIQFIGTTLIVGCLAGLFSPVRRRRTNKVNLKPVNDRIVILRDEAPTESPGGIILVSNDKTPKSLRGTVVAVGCDVEDYEVDDVVFFPPYNGHELEYEGTKYLVLKADEVLAIDE